jgi:dynein heavy chain
MFFIALWKHEAERVFMDKLTNSKDKDTVITFVQDAMLDTFT